MNNHIDIAWEATNIICKHTEAYMSGTEYKPNDAHELYETMVEQCSYMLTTKFLAKEYTPMQYNAIRNEIANQLFNCFIDHL